MFRVPCAIALAGFVFIQCSFAGQAGRLPSPQAGDPCGLPDTTSEAYRLAATQNWGYGYDSLRADLARWASSPFVRIDSAGASVQNRALYLLSIEDTAATFAPRQRVWIHARTHPNEVQGTWVTNEIIKLLLGPSPLAVGLRRSCVFSIIPMINPDGVELQYARENANHIDIESNWTAVPGEPEVQTLRRVFAMLMAQPNPIRIALNMHSAYGGGNPSRYFVYHDETGTSQAYAAIEQRYINAVRGYFPGGIRPYNYFVSWINAPSLVYPESWFWQNHRESVLALTYEDMNSPLARAFDSTAYAILGGIADELGVVTPTYVPMSAEIPATIALEQNYPNPFNPTTTIRYSVGGTQIGFGPAGPGSGTKGAGDGGGGTGSAITGPVPGDVRLAVYDLLGREVTVLVHGTRQPGTYTATFDAHGLATGTYLYRLEAGGLVQFRRMILLR